MARVVVPGRFVVVTGRTSGAVEPGSTRGGMCCAVRRATAWAKAEAQERRKKEGGKEVKKRKKQDKKKRNRRAVISAISMRGYSMEWYWYIWLVFCAGLLLVTIGTLIYRVLKKKRYVFFRLLDEKTGRPVAGVQVRGLVVSNSYSPSYATSVGATPVYAVTKQTSERYKLLGYTDEQGIFRKKVSFLSYASLWLENESPSVRGLVSRDHVSQEGRFPARPFVCKVAFGMVQPPEHVLD